MIDVITAIFVSLVAQLDSLFRHCRQGSIKTRRRYYAAFKRFCLFLSSEYRVRNLKNINPKHLVAYVLDMQNRGLSAAYIKTELAAIRFWHDKISRPRYRLPSNSELGIDLEKRHFGGVDRTWTNVEVEAMCRIAASMGRRDYITAIILGRYAGLRLEEALGLDRAAAEAAIRTGELTVKGKGGRVRTIPVAPEVAETLKAQMKTVRRGSKLWVPEDMPTHTAMAQMEAFLAAHRDEVADLTSDRKVPLTFHGLRHTYAAVKYHALRDVGMSEKEARRRVSELLGHNREDVTKVYTYSVEG